MMMTAISLSTQSTIEYGKTDSNYKTHHKIRGEFFFRKVRFDNSNYT